MSISILVLLLMNLRSAVVETTVVDSTETGYNSNVSVYSTPSPTAGPETRQSLFFTSPGGASSFAARNGLYGIAVDFRRQTDAELPVDMLLPVSFDCLSFRDDVIANDGIGDDDLGSSTADRDLRVRSMSYDSVSGHVLMDLASRDDFSLTLIRGRPCQGPEAEDSDEELSMTRCGLTKGNGNRNVNKTATLFHGSTEVLFFNAKVTDSVRIGPFAYYDSRLFFVLQRFEKPDYRTKLNVIEIRQMSETCADGSLLDVPVTATSSAFDVLECSTVVANVTMEKYETVHAYRPLNTLLVVSRDDDKDPSVTYRLDKDGWPPHVARGRLDFYVQLQRLTSITETSINISVILYHASMPSSPVSASSVEERLKRLYPSVAPPPPRWPGVRKVQKANAVDDETRNQDRQSDVSRESWAEVVHEVSVGSSHMRYVLVQLGGIDHRRSTLCWAAVDRIFCGRRSAETGRLDDIVSAVDAGQAAAVCHAPDNSPELRHVITGVAMSYAVADREVALYFGCAAQIGLDDIGLGGQIGGAGLVRLPAYGVWPASITPLRLRGSTASGRGEEAILAGAMFVVDKCANFSAWDVEDSLASSVDGLKQKMIWIVAAAAAAAAAASLSTVKTSTVSNVQF